MNRIITRFLGGCFAVGTVLFGRDSFATTKMLTNQRIGGTIYNAYVDSTRSSIRIYDGYYIMYSGCSASTQRSLDITAGYAACTGGGDTGTVTWCDTGGFYCNKLWGAKGGTAVIGDTSGQTWPECTDVDVMGITTGDCMYRAGVQWTPDRVQFSGCALGYYKAIPADMGGAYICDPSYDFLASNYTNISLADLRACCLPCPGMSIDDADWLTGAGIQPGEAATGYTFVRSDPNTTVNAFGFKYDIDGGQWGNCSGVGCCALLHPDVTGAYADTKGNYLTSGSCTYDGSVTDYVTG